MTIMEMLDHNAALVLLGAAVVVFLIWRIVIKAKKKNDGFQKPGPDEDTGSQLGHAPGTSRQVIAAVTAAVDEYRKTENRE